jgi:hypothetical protein
MTLTKTQKTEIKKIESGFKKMEKLTESNEISLDAYVLSQDFHFSNLSDEHRNLVNEQSQRRQDIFKQNKQTSKPKQ